MRLERSAGGEHWRATTICPEKPHRDRNGPLRSGSASLSESLEFAPAVRPIATSSLARRNRESPKSVQSVLRRSKTRAERTRAADWREPDRELKSSMRESSASDLGSYGHGFFPGTEKLHRHRSS